MKRPAPLSLLLFFNSAAAEPEASDDAVFVTPEPESEVMQETEAGSSEETSEQNNETEEADEGDKVLFEVETQEDDADKES